MKVHSVGAWLGGILLLVFVGWQLSDALLHGHMVDFFFDDDDLYFFDSPLLFIGQFVVFAAIGAGVVFYGFMDLAMGRRKK